MDRDSFRDAIRSNPKTSMRQHARKLGVGAAAVQRAVAKLGAKSRVIVERQLITLTIRGKRNKRCQMFVNDLESAPARG